MDYTQLDQSLLMMIIGLVGLFIGYLVARIFYITRIRHARRDAIKRSRSVLRGHASEKLAPFLPNFPYKARDMNFVGKGIDYIIFDGMSNGEIQEVVLLEIKSGSARQNKNERLIEQAINAGRVRYEIWRR